FDAVELCRKYRPDLVLMDVKMPLLNGIKASRMIYEEGIAGGVLLLTAYSGKEYVEEAKDVGVLGYIVKPVNEDSLLPMLEIAIANSEEFATLREHVKGVEDQLENRKIIEKAKGLLMQQENMSEDEAFIKIRKLAMDKRCSMKEISKIILMNG
ncbi:MAG: ANTAR domain-containing protein, partial [Desulfobacterales bacterium]|nr:ANTAR domain-containing protein [Desulfobacterales bacterium]